MIELLHRNNLDMIAYTDCVSMQSVSLLYAQPWYLDAVTDSNWYAVVSAAPNGGYAWVLPFFSFRKWAGIGASVAANPLLVQQCGPWGHFSDDDIFSAFVLIRDTFGTGSIALSQEVLLSRHLYDSLIANSFSVSFRINQQIVFSDSTASVFDGLNKTRKKHWRRGSAIFFNSFSSSSACLDAFLKCKGLSSLGLKNKHVRLLQALISSLDCRGLLHKHYYTINGMPQLCLLLAEYGDGIVSLLGGPVNDGASLFLQDVAIVAELELLLLSGKSVFDFEGSNIPGVAAYNATFGAVSFPYIQISW